MTQFVATVGAWLRVTRDARREPGDFLLRVALAGALCLGASGPSLASTPAGTSVTNQGEVVYRVGGISFSQSSNIDEVVVHEPPPPDSAVLTLTVSPASTRPAETVTLVITLTNIGSNALADGMLMLPLPLGATLNAPPGWSVVEDGGTGRIAAPVIPVGGAIRLQLELILGLDHPSGATTLELSYEANDGAVDLSAAEDLTVAARSTAVLEGLRYAPGRGAPTVQVPSTEYDTGSGFAVFPPPELPDQPGVLVTDGPIELLVAPAIHSAQTLFVRIADADQNRAPDLVETILVDTEVLGAGLVPADAQTYALSETGPGTGLFVGYVQTTTGPAAPNDGRLAVTGDSRVVVQYRDPLDPRDTAEVTMLVDPFGRVFDSSTGQPIDGVAVSLIDAVTDLPATVFGDDGISSYPSTVVTGATATDSGGTDYDFPTGGFRFPLVPTGDYRLEIALPDTAGYRWPSTVDETSLQTLTGAPFAIVTGSRGEPFSLAGSVPLHVDLPLDPLGLPLWIAKFANRSDAASGDFLQYRVEVENTRTVGAASAVVLTDMLPPGFRYEPGSTRIDGNPAADPSVAADGRTLEFGLADLAPASETSVTYVVRLGVVRPGDAVNYAVANGSGGLASNTASATVRVREDLFRSHTILMGRVAVADSQGEDEDHGGIAGVRIYLEDGTYILTDERGKFHFEGIRPGTHVVQLDLDTLPEPYELLPASPNSRFAGRSWSRFVELQGGAMWRVDFDVALKPTPTGSVSLRMESAPNEDCTSQDYRIELTGSTVPVGDARLVVMLPEGATYTGESSRLDGLPLPDPEVTGRVATYRMGDLPAEWNTKVTLAARIDPAAGDGTLVSRAFLVFDTPETSNQRTPVVENVVRLERRPAVVETTEFTARTHFDPLGTELRDGGQSRLDELALDLDGQENVRLHVVGHADDKRIRYRSWDQFADNDALSLARAETVAQYLLDESGLEPSLTEKTGKGDSEPIADNETEEGRALNRRVDVRALADEPRVEYESVTPGPVSDVKSIETTGLRPDQASMSIRDERETTPEPAESLDRYDGAWIETVAPGSEWVLPAAGHRPRISSIPIGIKHAPGEQLDLTLNGEPVSGLNFERTITNQAGTVAFSLWRGVDLIEGDNRLQAVLRDANGREVGRLERVVHYPGPPVRAELVESESTLVADGRTTPVVAVRLLDRDGQPAREGAIGRYRVEPPYLAEEPSDFNSAVMPGAAPQLDRYVIGRDGIARIRLQPTTEAGEAWIAIALLTGDYEILAPLRPVTRDWILVGLAEGTVGYNTLDGNLESLDGNAREEDLYADGRVAFYAKGRVKGQWLLTLAYDSKKETGTREQGLYQTIDPGTYYTVYGDESTQRFDASSSEKLYFKIERDQFFALFGDFDTGLTVSELSRYSRSLTGLKSRYRDRRFEFIAFASDSDQGFVRDEIRGQGITGPYRLSRPDLVMNSEKVAVEVRDRFRSEVILSTEILTRHVDYDIDYVAETLIFRLAIPSTDDSFNPIFIVVDYESYDDGDHSLTYGGRAQIDVKGRMLVGVTHVSEALSEDETRLSGVDLTYLFGPLTRARVEYAYTSGTGPSGDAYLAEVEHRAEKAGGRVYFRENENDFGLGQINRSEGGTRKFGAEGAYLFADRWNAHGQVYRQENFDTDATRDVAEAETVYQLGSAHVGGGVRLARDETAVGESTVSHLITAGASKTVLGGKLKLRVGRDQPLGESDANVDYPARTRLGLDYLLSHDTTVFAEQEWANGAERDTQNTVVGLKTTPWQGSEVSTSVRRARAGSTGTTVSTLALRQRWLLGADWSIDTSLERVRTLAGRDVPPFDVNVPFASGADTDFTAASLGLTYSPGNWIWNTRLDFRDATSDEKWGVAASAQTDPRSDLSVLIGARLLGNRGSRGADRFLNDVRLGLAYRPSRGRWLLLNRLEWIQDRSEGDGFDFDNRRIVNNLNANRRVNRWQVSLQYGAKFVRDTIDGLAYDGYTDLIGLEIRYDFTPRWDLGWHGSVLHAWQIDQYDYSDGLSVGRNVMQNMWVSIGYNLTGFDDRDFSAAKSTSRGPFLRFRIKLDQQSVRDAARWFGR